MPSIPYVEDFYNFFEGGSNDKGRTINPYTKKPYTPNIVPRGDYARVLAEFWADGPDSETPPGHWFSILNYVSDNPVFEKRYQGKGPILDPLEWDVKSYFVLGGVMHDVAISVWGIKGWYDYIRPISAIRYFSEQGQGTDPSLDNYNEYGFELIDGLIEIVQAGDPLAGDENENVGKIKLYTWKGHTYVENTESDFKYQLKSINLGDNLLIALPTELTGIFDRSKIVLPDGSEAPEWIKYDPITGEISATPPEDISKLDLKLIIDDEGKIIVRDLEIEFDQENIVEDDDNDPNKFIGFKDQLDREFSNWDEYGSQIINRL